MLSFVSCALVDRSLLVVFEELSLITIFENKRKLIKFNENKCCKLFGKNFLLLLVLLPLAALIVLILIGWDIYGMAQTVDGEEATTDDTYTNLIEVALFFGDVLFWKHLVMKWISLKTMNLNISLFMEGHVHLFNEELLEDQLKRLLGFNVQD